MDWSLIFVGFIVGLALSGVVYLLLRNRAGSNRPYRKFNKIMSSSERSFYGLLESVVDDQLELFAKVRVADVLAPGKKGNQSKWQAAFDQISCKHFDYILCAKKDFEILCAIELDDDKHKQKKHSEFLATACESAGLKLFRFKAEASYTKSEIKAQLSTFVHFEEPASGVSG